jgi:hypothetical protein
MILRHLSRCTQKLLTQRTLTCVNVNVRERRLLPFDSNTGYFTYTAYSA